MVEIPKEEEEVSAHKWKGGWLINPTSQPPTHNKMSQQQRKRVTNMMDWDSLNEWAKDKPLSILQLDPADRAVLKIAGECLYKLSDIV